MNRLKRQTVIRRLVTENEIRTQGELLTLLEKENIHITQVTISRDIRELNLNKIDSGQGEAYYRVLNNSAPRPKYRTGEERLVDIVIETDVPLTQIEFTDLLTVLPGNGQATRVLIDRMRIHNPHVLDYIAGDDIILILSRNKEDVLKVNNYFQQYLYHP